MKSVDVVGSLAAKFPNQIDLNCHHDKLRHLRDIEAFMCDECGLASQKKADFSHVEPSRGADDESPSTAVVDRSGTVLRTTGQKPPTAATAAGPASLAQAGSPATTVPGGLRQRPAGERRPSKRRAPHAVPRRLPRRQSTTRDPEAERRRQGSNTRVSGSLSVKRKNELFHHAW
jgi:hypothetical protein